MLKRRGQKDNYLSTIEDLDGYFKDLEVELKKDVTLKIVKGRVKFEEHRAVNKALYEEKLSEGIDGHKVRETEDERNKRLGKYKPKTVAETEVIRAKAANKPVKADKSLFKIIQSNPNSFKSASINLSRKKMRKLAGIDANDPLRLDGLSSAQRQNLEKVVADRYTSEEIKSIYNVCLNYRESVQDPKRKELNFRKSKEMIFKSIDHFEALLDKPEPTRSNFVLKRHRSSASLRSG
jgi:hypothetical protein